MCAVKYEHWTRNGREEIFKVKPTGEVLCCGGAANRLNEQSETIDELAALLRLILPHIPPTAIDGKKARTHKVSECYLNDLAKAALAKVGGA